MIKQIKNSVLLKKMYPSIYFKQVQIGKIVKQIDEENEKTETLLESKNLYIKVLEQKIFDRFEQEALIRKEIEKKLLTLIEDKFSALKVEISKESRNRYESIENLKNYLEVQKYK